MKKESYDLWHPILPLSSASHQLADFGALIDISLEKRYFDDWNSYFFEYSRHPIVMTDDNIKRR
ncbi:MAG: hypothetical protein Q8P72_00440, partial [Candidatus Roizmanbacteria bacterium]|nr:hypothetical protein [Candidatus Roizmanbacteria bacterium]